MNITPVGSLEIMPILKIDFDGCIVTEKFPSIGDPLPMAIETLRKFHEHKYNTILWTCREGDPLIDAIDFLHQNGVYFDVVNQGHPMNPYRHLGQSRKPFAHYHIDDKNIFAKIDWQEIHDYFFKTKKYHEILKVN